MSLVREHALLQTMHGQEAVCVLVFEIQGADHHDELHADYVLALLGCVEGRPHHLVAHHLAVGNPIDNELGRSERIDESRDGLPDAAQPQSALFVWNRTYRGCENTEYRPFPNSISEIHTKIRERLTRRNPHAGEVGGST